MEYAIIGMSCRFPESNNTEDFFNNMLNGKSTIRKLNTNKVETKESNYVNVSSTITNPYSFDNNFFNITPRDAKLMDPQQRIFLECSFKALEDGGYTASSKTKNIGVFGSAAFNTYYLDSLFNNNNVIDPLSYSTLIGNSNDFLSTRVSNKLNLSGPSMTIQSGCSSSLVAVNEACKSILLGECDLALAGGVSISFPTNKGYYFEEGSIFSKTGSVRPFDADASGIVKGDGCGVVLLESYKSALKNNDNIYAVISGIGINNDGNRKVGFTAPSIIGERDAIKMALNNSSLNPSKVEYIETHGTGTKLGDPIEIRALSDAYGTDVSRQIGSLKSNFGHMDTASGIAGLIKCAMILKKGIIPKSINFDNPNPLVNFEKSNLFIDTINNNHLDLKLKHYVGLSSFGIGGTNAHLILHNHIERSKSIVRETDHEVSIIISSEEKQSLRKYEEKLMIFLEKNSNIDIYDLTYTFLLRRKQFKYYQIFTFSSIKELILKIKKELNNDGKEIKELKDSNKLLEDLIKPLKGINNLRTISLPTYYFSTSEFKYNGTTFNNNKSIINSLNSIPDISSICRIWTDVIGREVYPDSDFFKLDGDSLIAIEIIETINNKYNLHLNTSELLSNPSPKGLFNLMNNTNFNNIQKLKSSNSNKTLILIHPAGGSTYCYKKLCESINTDVNIYTISFPENMSTSSSIQELAKKYCDTLKNICFNSDFILGGYSFGGNVAVEMVRILEEEGVHVKDVILIDSLPPEAYSKKPLKQEVYESIFPNLWESMTHSLIDSNNIDSNKKRKLLKVWSGNHIALSSQSNTQISSQLTIFSASEYMSDSIYKTMRMKKIDPNQWNKYSNGDIEIYPIKGNHFTIMSNEKNVEQLSKQISFLLEKSFKE